MTGNYFNQDERFLALKLCKNLINLSNDTLTHEDIRNVYEIVRNGVANNHFQRDQYGINPTIRVLNTALLLAENIHADRDMIIAVGGCMPQQIAQELKEQRAEMIMRRQLDISLQINREKIGQTLEVLVEEEDEDGSYLGRTRYDAPEIDDAVIFTSVRRLTPGMIVNVLIEDAFDYDLTGKEV